MSTPLVFLRTFAPYLVVDLAEGVSYVFIPYYVKFGALIDLSHDLLLYSFYMKSIASTIPGLLSSTSPTLSFTCRHPPYMRPPREKVFFRPARRSHYVDRFGCSKTEL